MAMQQPRSYADAVQLDADLPPPSNQSATPTPQIQPKNNERSSFTDNSDRKFNIIVFGIPECPKGSRLPLE